MTLRGTRNCGCCGSRLSSAVPPRGSRRDAAGRRVRPAVLLVPVRGPLPDVARHVGEAEPVDREAADRRGRPVADLGPPREVPVPVVRARTGSVLRLVAPDVGRAFQAAASGSLPLGLGREHEAGPRRVRLGVLGGHLHHRVRAPVVHVAPWTLGVTPAGARRPGPPLTEVPQIDRAGRRGEDHRAGHEVLDRGTGKVRGVQRAFRHGLVAGRLDEGRELGVGDRGPSQPEPADFDVARRSLLGVVGVRTHPEHPTRDPHQVARRWLTDGRRLVRGRHALGRPACILASACSTPKVAGF